MAKAKRYSPEQITRILKQQEAGVKERVDRGEKLTEYDLIFLNDVMEDSAQAQTLAKKHPEFQPLLDRLASLYSDITDKALKNEQNSEWPRKSQGVAENPGSL